MPRLMAALEFRSFHSHRSCENVPNTTRLAPLQVMGIVCESRKNSTLRLVPLWVKWCRACTEYPCSTCDSSKILDPSRTNS